MVGHSRVRIPAVSTLIAFECAGRLGNFSRAAEELQTSQSAVSRHIARLERQLSTRVFDRSRTGDYQTTRGITEILDRGGNVEDLVGFMEDRNLPLDEIGRMALAERVLSDPPTQGFITISNALQWRLQYGHAIASAGRVDGVQDLFS